MGNLCSCIDPIGQRLREEDEQQRRYQAQLQQQGAPQANYHPAFAAQQQQPQYVQGPPPGYGGGPPPGYGGGPPPGYGGGPPQGYGGPPSGYGMPPAQAPYAMAPAGVPQQQGHFGMHTAPMVVQGPVQGVPHTGNTRALLIGINYYRTQAELRGCINDVAKMRTFLSQRGFSTDPSRMVILTDDQHDPQFRPTRANILNALQWLAAGAAPGDALFFHFSGHGAQQEDHTGTEDDGMDETICPVDFDRAGMITDDTIFSLIVAPLPSGCRLTAVMDCCHSGTGLDLPLICQGDRWVEEDNPHHTLGDVQLFSGCEDSQTSADAAGGRYQQPGGAMTTAFVEVVEAGQCSSYPHLMDALHRSLRRNHFDQRPLLSASQPFNLQRGFALVDCHPNVNPQVRTWIHLAVTQSLQAPPQCQQRPVDFHRLLEPLT